MKKTVFVFVALVAYTAFAQVRYGTVIVVNFTKDKLVMAADSRVIDANGNRPPDDSYCKVVAFGHKVVFASVGTSGATSGSIVYRGPTWNNYEMASTAIKESILDGAQGKKHLQNIVTRWVNSLVPIFRSYSLSHPEEVARWAELGNGVLTSGVFADAVDGTIYGQVGLVTFNKNRFTPIDWEVGDMGNCWPCGQEEGSEICAGGKVAVPAEFCAGNTERAKRESLRSWTISESLLEKFDRTTLLPIRIADLTVAYDLTGTVAGKIDALELRKDGSIRWIARKCNCPENQD